MFPLVPNFMICLFLQLCLAQTALCALLGGFGCQLFVKEKGGKLGCLLCGECSIPSSSALVHGFVEKLELF